MLYMIIDRQYPLNAAENFTNKLTSINFLMDYRKLKSFLFKFGFMINVRISYLIFLCSHAFSS